MKTLTTALAAAILFTAPSIASATERQGVSVAVSTQGIDFKDPASVNKFRFRVARAIAEACAPADEIQTGRRLDLGCAKSMRQSGDTRIAQIQAKTNSAMATME